MNININYLVSQIWSYNVFFFFLAIKLLICLQVLQFILLLFVGVNFQLFVEIIAKIPKKKLKKSAWLRIFLIKKENKFINC
jgi:hypothetical protein